MGPFIDSIRKVMNPEFSIIIPVYNEEAVINDAVDRLYEGQQGESFELLVVDGNGGGTLRALQRAGVRGLLSAKGRACQMNRGAAEARGQILLFLHADTTLPPGALALIKAALQDDKVKAGAFNLRIDSAHTLLKIISFVSSLRSRLTREPYGDQAIFIRADYFSELGGYKELPLMEDVDLMHRIKQDRQRLNIITQPVSTSARRWESEGILYCTLRNWTLITLYKLGISPETLCHFYKFS